MKNNIPTTVFMLGFVSLFMDFSSELVHSLLPLLLVNVLHTSMLEVGIIEGVAEATALIIKVFSGTISDAIGKRKVLLLIGYGLSTFSKPLFPLAQHMETVFFARFADRIGKGVRDAPRDALIADVTPKDITGASYGLRQSMDTIGAVIGPLAAVALLFLLDDIRVALWFAFIPALITMYIIFFKIQEPTHVKKAIKQKKIFSLSIMSSFPSSFWVVVSIGSLFMLARFSEAFLILKAQEAGFKIELVPLVMVVMSIAYVFSAYPAGVLSDRLQRKHMLSLGLIFLMISDLILATASSYAVILLGAFLWGIHMGFSQGILTAMVADTAPKEKRGSAFGFFNLFSGLSMLLSSIFAGWLWQSFNSSFTFYAGALFALFSFMIVIWKLRNS
ncbi:MFS transporter [Sulfurimonas microaerophilic]|uniref:MFS transporter n=1 Tax=Sulfurimonas microaerophilic TaxID=3058392 RepID=UPI0027155AD2|nr:MFS transporter [Sulfurimonas sp. hsl 1-7]